MADNEELSSDGETAAAPVTPSGSLTLGGSVTAAAPVTPSGSLTLGGSVTITVQRQTTLGGTITRTLTMNLAKSGETGEVDELELIDDGKVVFNAYHDDLQEGMLRLIMFIVYGDDPDFPHDR
jgi:hypothetical protein